MNVCVSVGNVGGSVVDPGGTVVGIVIWLFGVMVLAVSVCCIIFKCVFLVLGIVYGG